MATERVDDDLLVAYALGELEPQRVARVEAHLASHPDDARRVRHLRAVVHAMRRDDTVAPPAHLMARAKAIFAASAPARPVESWLDRLERVIARLVFDSRAEPAPAGFRAADTACQLSYESDLADVDLQVEEPPDPQADWTVLGQVTVHGRRHAERVALLREGAAEAVAQARPDEHGMFRLRAPRGRYQLVIRIDRQGVVLPDVALE